MAKKRRSPHMRPPGERQRNWWGQARRDRYEEVGGCCEVCREPVSIKNAVAHHLINHSEVVYQHMYKGKPLSHQPFRLGNSVANAQIRHKFCESYCTFYFEGGNPPHEGKKQVADVARYCRRYKISWNEFYFEFGKYFEKEKARKSEIVWTVSPQFVRAQS